MTQESSSVLVYMEPGNSCGDLLPPGYRCNPKDEELILHYLMKKVSNQPLLCNIITSLMLMCTSKSEKLMLSGDKKGFCFTPRDRLYAKGQRPNRRGIDGYWKATGAEQKIKYSNRKPYVAITKRALVFYRGRPPKGDKTQWIMHEYNLYNEDHKKGTAKDMRLDNCVLCSIYYKGKTVEGSSHHENVNEPMGTLDFNHNDDNVKSLHHLSSTCKKLNGTFTMALKSLQSIYPNNSANHIHNHNADSFEEGLMINS
uniref:NAC transcription factor 86 n=1 Tax=Litchi chinensis TaxID=151069 RepID=A0A8K1I005_LITCN|nr:NAC transcription factor 86 [Litchi chinensis]